MEPGGPAGVSRFTTPSSTATCAARATGLVTDASANTRAVSPWVASTLRVRSPRRPQPGPASHQALRERSSTPARHFRAM